MEPNVLPFRDYPDDTIERLLDDLIASFNRTQVFERRLFVMDGDKVEYLSPAYGTVEGEIGERAVALRERLRSGQCA